jgi:hypothetical protein
LGGVDGEGRKEGGKEGRREGGKEGRREGGKEGPELEDWVETVEWIGSTTQGKELFRRFLGGFAAML